MVSPAPSAFPAAAETASAEIYRGPFAIMTLLFFMWGFMAVWNDILIPRFKETFTANYFQAMLVHGWYGYRAGRNLDPSHGKIGLATESVPSVG